MADTHPRERALKFPVLVGDIGGTNARFAILVDPHAEPTMFPIQHTADHATIDAAIRKGVLDHTPLRPRSAVLAVAGPIDGDEIDLTNNDWVVRPPGMMDTLGLEDIIMVNDFEAQALAVIALGATGMEKIGGGEAEEHAGRVVLGPGTGLGVAGLVQTREIWIPVPGEGGHVDFGPRSDRDFEIFPHLEPIEGRISAEQVLCGRGLQNIYRAVCKAGAIPPSLDAPADITHAALAGTDPQAEETLKLFTIYLGRLAGDFALTFMSRGGVYLAGGIPQRIIPALMRPDFRAAFEDKAPHSAILKAMPVYVVTHPMAALSGLAAYASTPGRFGVPTEGRRWRR